jgi:hypothetical protein
MRPDPDKVIGMRHTSYEKLNEHGYVPEEIEVVNGDIIIGKVTPLQDPIGNKQYKDSSDVYKSHEPAVIDRLYTGIQNQDGYEIRKVVLRSERTPKVGDKYCCFSSDHDILTTTGWVNVADVTLEHKVASLIDGKRLEYKNPTELQSYDINEDVYVVDSNQVSLKVTKNHRMYIADRAGKKFKIDLAENIYGKQRKYKKNISEYIPENPMNVFKLPAYKDQPEKDLNMDAWLSFFGIWMAEGCSEKTRRVQFAAHKQRVKDELTRVCEILGYELRHNKDNADDIVLNKWCIRDKQLTEYLTPLSVGAVNKKLPEWVWQLNTSQCRILIHGMMLGDGCDSSIDELNHKNYSENNFFGHEMDNGTKRYDTSSTILADQFQRLCLHAGFSTNKKLKCEAGYEAVGKTGKNEGVVFKTSVDAWRLTIIETQNEPLVNKTVSAGKQLDRYENYNGRVYCCTVPTTDGVIYVRRNGMPVWCGNSRYGQKGTCGILLEGQDMPFNKYGIRPDIILNPNAIPKRQTIGQLDECLLSKVCALDCYDGDGTSFEPYDFKKVEKRLEELGYDSKGYEELVNGMTGQKLNVNIFFGPTYYQRLKHMVLDKIHSRSRGPRTMYTRQPPEGRTRDGGLRCGEMERDAIIAHGISKFLHEKMMYNSDAYATYVCDLCGLFAQRAIRKENTKEPSSTDTYYCPSCNNCNKISKVIIPYAFKLLIQILLAMNIAPRIKTLETQY